MQRAETTVMATDSNPCASDSKLDCSSCTNVTVHAQRQRQCCARCEQTGLRCNREGYEQPEIKGYHLCRQHEQRCAQLVWEFKTEERECDALRIQDRLQVFSTASNAIDKLTKTSAAFRGLIAEWSVRTRTAVPAEEVSLALAFIEEQRADSLFAAELHELFHEAPLAELEALSRCVQRSAKRRYTHWHTCHALCLQDVDPSEWNESAQSHYLFISNIANLARLLQRAVLERRQAVAVAVELGKESKAQPATAGAGALALLEQDREAEDVPAQTATESKEETAQQAAAAALAHKQAVEAKRRRKKRNKQQRLQAEKAELARGEEERKRQQAQKVLLATAETKVERMLKGKVPRHVREQLVQKENDLLRDLGMALMIATGAQTTCLAATAEARKYSMLCAMYTELLRLLGLKADPVAKRALAEFCGEWEQAGGVQLLQLSRQKQVSTLANALAEESSQWKNRFLSFLKTTYEHLAPFAGWPKEKPVPGASREMDMRLLNLTMVVMAHLEMVLDTREALGASSFSLAQRSCGGEFRVRQMVGFDVPSVVARVASNEHNIAEWRASVEGKA